MREADTRRHTGTWVGLSSLSLIQIQTPAYGGGEIHFDGKLIRKDGRFVPAALQVLNPENLK